MGEGEVGLGDWRGGFTCHVSPLTILFFRLSISTDRPSKYEFKPRVLSRTKEGEDQGNMIHFVVVHDGPPLSDTHTDVPKLCDATKNVIVPFLDNAIHQIKEEDGDSSVCLVVDALALRAVEISQCYWIPKVIIWTSPIATYALIYDIPPLVSSQIIPSSQHLIIYDLVYALMDIL